jgi:hypothetical protein
MLEQNLWPRRSSFSWGLLASSFGGRHSAMAGATRSLINIESTKRVSHQAQPLGGRKPGAEEWAPSEAMRIIAAAALYFLIVYCVGFLLGALRVFWLEPRLGETVAVLCEAPFVLIASVLAARWLPTILSLRITTASLLAMGIGALCLQQLADDEVNSTDLPPHQHRQSHDQIFLKIF